MKKSVSCLPTDFQKPCYSMLLWHSRPLNKQLTTNMKRTFLNNKIILMIIFSLISSVFVFSADFTVQYRCAQTEPVINKIKPQFKIINNSSASVPLSEFKIRYYFTAEGYVTSVLSIDYARMGSANVIGTFYKDYLEIKFSPSAGTIIPGANSGEIQLRIEKSSHGNYIQTDDYSFAPQDTDWTENNRVTCYHKDVLVWGNEPPPPATPIPPPPAGDDWLHADGNTLKDKNGHPIKLTGINWFGFETNPQGLGGLQAVNWMDTLTMLTKKGFNVLRLPLSLALVKNWMAGKDPLVNFVNGQINPTIDGISSLKLLDELISYCKIIGLKIIFDLHTLDMTDIQKKVWYNSTYSLKDYQSGLLWLTARYKNDDTIIAIDLFNEPHGQGWVDRDGARWDGSSEPTNWKKAAQDTSLLILAENPNLLVIVEGIESTPVEGATYDSTDKYQYICNWWGGNLRGVKKYPINLGNYQNKLVYSAHDYGPDIYVQPWFQQTFTKATLYRDCWQPNWYYIVEDNIAPIFIGEWGGKLGGNNQLWLEALAQFISENNVHHTFWCFNPDSSDTGGIVDENYVFNTAKYNIIEKTLWKDSKGKYIGLDHEVILSGTNTGTNVTLYYGGILPTPAGTPTPTPTATAVIKKGDVNNDTVIDIIDALLIAQKSVGIEVPVFNETAADMNNDGAVNIVDALLIAQYSVGLIPEF